MISLASSRACPRMLRNESPAPVAGRRPPRGTVVERIRTELSARIIRGLLLPGERLLEQEIAASHEASQASVREALERLERDGLVERQGRRGTRVTALAMDDVRDALLARCDVEERAIRSCAVLIRPGQLRELEGLARSADVAGAAIGEYEAMELDLAFRERLVVWAQRPALARAWRVLATQVARGVVYGRLGGGRLSVALLHDHAPTIRALSDGDPARAAAVVARCARTGVGCGGDARAMLPELRSA